MEPRNDWKPPFNTTLTGGASFEAEPPFSFQGVTVRVFPLKADIYVLGEFCDSYLNISPTQIDYFRPALPYVYLLVLDYGKLSAEVVKLGWVSQHEVAFIVGTPRVLS